jgi:hypothetical protein
MATQPVKFDRFGGLNLNDPQEIGPDAAVDLLNVSPEADRLKTRPGFANVVTLAAGDTANALAEYPSSGGAVQLLVSGNAKLYAYDNGSTLIDEQTTNGGSSIVVVGTPTATAAYIAGPTNGIYKYDGTTFSLPVTSIAPKLLALSSRDNRLVAANTSSTNVSRVAFSDPGAPETFGANNFVDLQPGDGECIAGLAAWRDQVFAFKRTKFFVFYGASTDADGEPVFNYRPVEGGVGVGGTAADAFNGPAQVCAGRNGVYFLADDGIYRTVGDTPQRVSAPLDFWFQRRVLPNCPTLNGLWDGDLTGSSIISFQSRVYCTFKAAGTSTTFVLNEDTGAWSIYRFTDFGDDLRLLAGCSFDDGSVTVPSALRTMRVAFSNSVIGRHDETRTTDNGHDVAWHWTSGMTDLGESARVKTTLESRVWGSGSVTLKVANDYGSVDAGSALTLGTAPAVTDAWQQIDREGTLWQHQVSGSGQASVSRLAHYVSFTKPAGVQ